MSAQTQAITPVHTQLGRESDTRDIVSAVRMILDHYRELL